MIFIWFGLAGIALLIVAVVVIGLLMPSTPRALRMSGARSSTTTGTP